MPTRCARRTYNRWQPPKGRRYWRHPLHPSFVAAVRVMRPDWECYDLLFKLRVSRVASEITSARGRVWASASWRERRVLQRLADAVGYTGPVLDRSEAA